MDPRTVETFRDQLDELRCHPTEWLRAERSRVVGEQRRLKVRELAITKVLDERDARDPIPDASAPASTAKATVEVARALETRPVLAQAAVEGRVSFEQLEPLTRIATPETDAEWAQRGPNCTPFDLQKLARRARKLAAEDAERRYRSRELRIWREPELGMIAGRFRLPDLDGILVQRVFDHLAEQMRPTPARRGVTCPAVRRRSRRAVHQVRRRRTHRRVQAHDRDPRPRRRVSRLRRHRARSRDGGRDRAGRDAQDPP